MWVSGNRGDINTNVENMEILIELNIYEGYLPSINIGLEGYEERVQMEVFKEFK